MKKISLFMAVLLAILFGVYSQIYSQELKTRVVAGGFRTIWEVLWANDGYLWITERSGKVSRINPDTGEKILLLTIKSVFEDGERGLMGMALHPNFENEPYVYLAYNHGNSNENTKIRIERYTYNGSSLINPTIILDNIKGWWNHDGARLHIDNDLKLWFTIGDAASKEMAQDLTNLNGKLSRTNLDGTVPNDNPFPNSHIWSFGHRNQQGMVFVGDKIYTSEHGASTNDEINLIRKGRNYGWPFVEGACNTPQEIDFCNKNNVVEPILSLTPVRTMAIAGIDYYNNTAIKEWQNSLLITSLKDETLLVANLSQNGEEVNSTSQYFANKFGRLRDVCVSPSGRVFVATSNQDGRASSKFSDSLDIIFEIIPLNTSVNTDDTRLNLIYPNPASDFITISCCSIGSYSNDNDAIPTSSIQIFNALGIELSFAGMDVNEVERGRFRIDISHLPVGVYFVHFGDKVENFIKI